jgi:hypothetical protein
MRGSSCPAVSEGRGHRRTIPGPPYQVSARTVRAPGVPLAAMSPLVRRLRRHALLGLVLMVLVGCSLEPAESFDPTGPCSGDGAAVGAYPDLEALVPTSYEERGPDRLDSGRNCTAENLGSLAEAGIDELRFAGGTWDFGSDIAVVLAVFRADGLTAERLGDFYASSARAAGRTEITGESELTVHGRAARRLDTKTGDRIQTVVVWPSADAGRVNVVLSHNLPDPKIENAIAAFGDS